MFGDSATEYLTICSWFIQDVNKVMAIFNMGHQCLQAKDKNGVEGNEINEIQLSKLQDFDVIEYGFPKLSAKEFAIFRKLKVKNGR